MKRGNGVREGRRPEGEKGGENNEGERVGGKGPESALASGQNGPKWTILVHFGLANATIQFGIRSF